MTVSSESNRVDIVADGLEPPSWIPDLSDYARHVLRRLNIADWDVSIVLASDVVMQRLNREWRGRNEVTDVLSFCAFEGGGPEIVDGAEISDRPTLAAGDIVLCPERIFAQASDFETTADEELRRVVIHGILHLAGHTHETSDFDTEPMLLMQEQLLNSIKETIL